MNLSPENKDELLARAAVVVLLLFWIARLFAHPHALFSDNVERTHDYLQQATYDHLFRRAILTDGEIPLRTPFLGGGYPLPANPQDPTFSPFTIVPLALGEAVGMKVNIALFMLIGALGFYALARRGYGASPAAAAFAAASFACSAWWLSRLYWGFYFKLYWNFVPWVWLFLLPRVRDGLGSAERRLDQTNLIGAGLLLALTLAQLGIGYVVAGLFFAVYLPLDAAVRARTSRGSCAGAAFGAVAAAFVLSCVFAAAKIIPMIELLMRNVRSVDDYNTYLGVFGGYPHFFHDFPTMLRALAFWSPTPHEPIAPGFGALALAVIGIGATWRRQWPLLAVAAWFLLISFGPYLPIDFFRPLWHLPIFRSMHEPYQLFTFFVLAAICLFAAMGADIVLSRAWPRAARYGIYILAWAALVWQVAAVNVPIAGSIFVHDAPAFEPAGTFHHVRGRDMVRGSPRSPHAQQYLNAARGVGTVDWDGDVLLPENVIPRYFVTPDDALHENPAYRGEAWFGEGAGRVSHIAFTSNTVTVEGIADADGVLLINQNFDRHFAANLPLFEKNGLLALSVPEGKFRAVLKYRPIPTYFGVAVSIAALAVVAGRAAARRRLFRKPRK
ncbi:hypothetical protein K8I61_06145 [bacterium]|nr:hypothetical protein [bacterium]